MIEIRNFIEEEWRLYREVRLRALMDSPDAFGSTHEESITRTDDEWRSRLDGIDSRHDCPLGVFENENIVGLAWGRIEPDAPGRADIYQMWTAPSIRGRGIGRQLLTRLIAWATDNGVREIVLGVTIGNQPAQALYESAGFVAVGDPEPLRPGSDKLVQKMQLHPCR